MPRRGATAFAPQDPHSPPRPCEAPGCAAAGEFRAPRSRAALADYLWFCLPHVREYNASWDFYRGMSPDEVEANLRHDTAWQRPTWPLGRLGGHRGFDPEWVRDPLGALRDTPLHATRRQRAREAWQHRADAAAAKPPPELRAALDVLGLAWPLDAPALRARWKELAKRLHPDANGGDRAAEERLKDVNRAYTLLRARVGAAHEPARGGPAGAPAAAAAAAT